MNQLAPTSVLAQFSVDETLPPAEYAHSVYAKLIYAKKSQDILFLALGKLLKEIRDKRLYEVLDYENFGQFLASDELSISRESAFLYIRVYEFFVEYLELDESYVATIPVSKLAMLVPVLKKMESKEQIMEFISDTENLRFGDFVREVRKFQNSTKPTVHWSEELDKWIVQYYDNATILNSLGEYKKD
jgi:hypothetical protein